MRVFVTGSTGFVGREVISQILELDIELICLVRSVPSRFRKEKRIKCHVLDFKEELNLKFSPEDKLLHLAWPYLDDYSDPRHVLETLPQHTSFLRTCINNGCTRLTIAGTCAEYDVMSLMSEGQIKFLEHKNKYALAKTMLRLEVKKLANLAGTSLAWARLAYVYGPQQREKSLAGALRRAAQNGDKLFILAEPNNTHDFVHVTDVARQLINICIGNIEGDIDVKSGISVTVEQFARQYVEDNNLGIKLIAKC